MSKSLVVCISQIEGSKRERTPPQGGEGRVRGEFPFETGLSMGDTTLTPTPLPPEEGEGLALASSPILHFR
jgi:hypothetical protein